MTNKTFDPDKLRDNAIVSIRLGIEDFQSSKKMNGDPARTLSAVRNLFSGVLLLFKYKIAKSVSSPEDGYMLIYNPPEILPKTDGNDGIIWEPKGGFKSTTIDTNTIKKRFDAFNIKAHWDAVEKLQECRNHLEHLHPINTLGEVAGFVAELFPVLRDFIEEELESQPAELLGSTWSSMLSHHDFYMNTLMTCNSAWVHAHVPEEMVSRLHKCQCEECGSPLLKPHPDDIQEELTVGDNDDSFKYQCSACNHSDLIGPLMIEILHSEHVYDIFSGDDPSIEECNACSRDTFDIGERKCLWCEASLTYKACSICGEGLGQGDQHNGGFCGYHKYVFDKD